ncbi:MAG: ParA family protein [Saprospiraceae bacterium]
MTRVISIANNKGGVGKTTSVQNLGAGLNKLGYSVLLIDLDPQANLTESFGHNRVGESIYDVLKGTEKLPAVKIGDEFFLIPSNLDLSVAEIEFSTRTARESILQRNLIDKVKGDFDYILIDCPPSLGLLTLNALVASDEILIPIDAGFFSMKGIDKFLYIVEDIKKNKLNPALKVSGVFVTMYENVILKKDIISTIEENFNQKVFSTKIRKNIALSEAQSTGQDIFSYSPNSNGAKDYIALVKEIFNLENQKAVA